jgi:hypothetical protein
MFQVPLADYSSHYAAMVRFFTVLEETLKVRHNLDFVLVGNDYLPLLERLSALMEIMRKLELPVSYGYVSDAIDGLKNAKEKNGNQVLSFSDACDVSKFLEMAVNTSVRELNSKKFLALTPSEARLADPDFKAWADDNFRDKFPSALYDLDEAAKCLAFGRSTASVFHLMRVSEMGARAVYYCLGITHPLTGNNRNLGTILGRIRDEIDHRGKKWDEYEEFKELWLLFDAVKDAWRNMTMHVEAKFTPAEADRVAGAVRAVMQKVSARMDEGGESKA